MLLGLALVGAVNKFIQTADAFGMIVYNSATTNVYMFVSHLLRRHGSAMVTTYITLVTYH